MLAFQINISWIMNSFCLLCYPDNLPFRPLWDLLFPTPLSAWPPQRLPLCSPPFSGWLCWKSVCTLSCSAAPKLRHIHYWQYRSFEAQHEYSTESCPPPLNCCLHRGFNKWSQLDILEGEWGRTELSAYRSVSYLIRCNATVLVINSSLQ